MNIKNKKQHFITGSVGLVTVAILHMAITAMTGSANIFMWFPLYTAFLTFMLIGAPTRKGSWQ